MAGLETRFKNGKYKNKTLYVVMKDDFGYVDWLWMRGRLDDYDDLAKDVLTIYRKALMDSAANFSTTTFTYSLASIALFLTENTSIDKDTVTAFKEWARLAIGHGINGKGFDNIENICWTDNQLCLVNKSILTITPTKKACNLIAALMNSKAISLDDLMTIPQVSKSECQKKTAEVLRRLANKADEAMGMAPEPTQPSQYISWGIW